MTYSEGGKLVNALWSKCDNAHEIMKACAKKKSDEMGNRFFVNVIIDGEIVMKEDTKTVIASRIIIL